MKLCVHFAIVVSFLVMIIDNVYGDHPIESYADKRECKRANEVSGVGSICDACPWITNPGKPCFNSAFHGCVCKEGYVRITDSMDSECVPKEKC
ncbi:hypothetical protein B4U79_19118 [Dinothrombium tinctorium]|uniref:Uncharacterized protein n=1 Tax=Dinothrombium tinctorium TaxID=1965070 RepID=A0A443QK78_9ACAR|nr:hypothetical protein B4U79_19118 [Dinothrombium tinctorium]